MFRCGFCLLFSLICASLTGSAQNPYSSYFYPDVTEQRVYVFKDTIGGRDSCFLIGYNTVFKHRKSNVVQYYGADGQLTEEFIYTYDSLKVFNYITVDKTRSLHTVSVPKNTAFPWNDRHLSRYTHHFPRVSDSVNILAENPAPEFKTEAFDMAVMGDHKRAISVSDTLRWTWVHLSEQKRYFDMVVLKSCFAEGYGLVRFHDSEMKSDYILSEIISVEEWRKRMKH
ncbi:MAG: hypothetical protein ACO1O6_12910 [Bacteroidota bacterium]